MTFLQPTNLSELAQCLHQKSGPECHLVAGCTDFLAQRNGQPWDAKLLISLTHLPELGKIECRDKLLSVGAVCTHTQVEEHPLVRRYFPALAAACAGLGSRQIRNRGTLGGSVGNASPAGDIYPVLLVLDAQAVVMNGDGLQRRIPANQLIAGIGKPNIEEDEAILAFELPLPRTNCINAFVKLGERARVTIAKISLAASIELKEKRIQSSKLVLGAVAEQAFCSSASSILEGRPLSRDLLPDLFDALSQEIQKSIPNRPSMPYKRQAVLGLADNLLTDLIGQANSL